MPTKKSLNDSMKKILFIEVRLRPSFVFHKAFMQMRFSRLITGDIVKRKIFCAWV